MIIIGNTMCRSAVAVWMLSMLNACASSEPVRVGYDAASDRSSYTSSRILLDYRDMSAGLAAGQRVMWQAVASCSGQACRPDEVALAFYNDSDSDLNLDYRRLRLVFDGTSHDWEDFGLVNEPEIYAVPRGEFIRVPLTSADFFRMATAKEVAILFGQTVAFDSPFEKRAAFRVLAGKIVLSLPEYRPVVTQPD